MEKYLLIIALVFIYSCGNSQLKMANSHNDPKAMLTKEQYALINEKVKAFPNQAQLSIAIIENGRVKYHGIKRINDSTVSIKNHDDVFEIGSITKVFTGTLLANCIVDNTIDLDNYIQNFLDFPLKDSVEISFKQLATHTSGLPRVPASLETVSLENPYRDFGEKELKIYLTQKLEMDHKPGEKCAYSNLGGGLLGYVLTKVEHTTYENLLQTKIFANYGMKNSTTDRSKVEGRLIKGLNDKGEAVSHWDLSVLMGAGGILSSVNDLSKFAIAQFDNSNKELEMARTSFFEVSESFSMGLGWSIIQTESGAEWNWHNGGTGGYTSSMIIDTQTKNGIIILSNISALGELTSNVTSLSPELMNTLEEK